MKLVKYMIILLILFGCQKEPTDREVYVIEKGKHYSNGNKWIKVPEAPFEVWIDYMWWYDDLIEDAFWNKLIGFSEDVHHHKNSARIAWRSTDKKIRFALYAYVDGERVIKEFPTRYHLEQTVVVQIYKNKNRYVAKIQDEQVEIEAGSGSYTYTLYPYFGGEKPAPHRMRFVFTFNP